MHMSADEYAEHLATGGYLGVPDAAIINYFFPDIGIAIHNAAGNELANFMGPYVLYLQFEEPNHYTLTGVEDTIHVHVPPTPTPEDEMDWQ